MERNVVVLGLPESGKTTYLAALWHLVVARELPTILSLDKLDGDATHLNALAARWRRARVQARTETAGQRLVSMSLRFASGGKLRISFPDISGEAYSRMWEERDCDVGVAELAKAPSVLFFIHSDTIRSPQWIVDLAGLAEKLGLPVEPDSEVPWHPRLAPTQVQIVDLLQLLQTRPLDVGPRRLAIVLSAWDKAIPERLTPDDFLSARLPLLDQYLRSGADEWGWRVWGVSAQGGDYDDIPDDKTPPSETAKRICDLDRASERIIVQFGNGAPTHDLTEPIQWLVS